MASRERGEEREMEKIRNGKRERISTGVYILFDSSPMVSLTVCNRWRARGREGEEGGERGERERGEGREEERRERRGTIL